jgi:Raf kinase inhibitor-like YbhB/YbcL family protein
VLGILESAGRMNETEGERMKPGRRRTGVSLLCLLAVACILPASKGGFMNIMSDAFVNGDPIPKKYSCDGRDTSPPLAWSGVPNGTRSLALIMEDPDAPRGLWTHWVLFNMPPDLTGLPEGTTAQDLPAGTVEGINSWKRAGYGGPCPPDREHRYYFRLFALDKTFDDLGTGTTREELLLAMQGHILQGAELMGRYER